MNSRASAVWSSETTSAMTFLLSEGNCFPSWSNSQFLIWLTDFGLLSPVISTARSVSSSL